VGSHELLGYWKYNGSDLTNSVRVFQVRVIDNHWTPCLLGFINASLRDNEGLRSSFISYRGVWGLERSPGSICEG